MNVENMRGISYIHITANTYTMLQFLTLVNYQQKQLKYSLFL